MQGIKAIVDGIEINKSILNSGIKPRKMSECGECAYIKDGKPVVVSYDDLMMTRFKNLPSVIVYGNLSDYSRVPCKKRIGIIPEDLPPKEKEDILFDEENNIKIKFIKGVKHIIELGDTGCGHFNEVDLFLSAYERLFHEGYSSYYFGYTAVEGYNIGASPSNVLLDCNYITIDIDTNDNKKHTVKLIDSDSRYEKEIEINSSYINLLNTINSGNNVRMDLFFNICGEYKIHGFLSKRIYDNKIGERKEYLSVNLFVYQPELIETADVIKQRRRYEEYKESIRKPYKIIDDTKTIVI